MKPTRVMTILLLMLAPVVRAGAQTPSWILGSLSDTVDGADDVIYAAVRWDPDGAGPEPEWLVVGGRLTTIEGVAVDRIAARNPWTATWQPLGMLGGTVLTLLVKDGELIAGGGFPGRIARWTGTSWERVGSLPLDGAVNALTVFDGELVAGGSFSSAGATPIGALARFDGDVWHELAGGLANSVPPVVWTLGYYDGKLIVGGSFTDAGGLAVSNIAAWNGFTWSAMGGGTQPWGFPVRGLTIYEGDLIAAGGFEEAGGVPAPLVARWNGTTWSAMGTPGIGSRDLVAYLGVHDGALLASTHVFIAPAVWDGILHRWENGLWEILGYADDAIHCFVPYGADLVVGGAFTQSAGVAASRLARWRNGQWSSYGGGSVSAVHAVASYNGRVAVGGGFHQSLPGQSASNILQWNGVDRRAFGAGMNGPVFALESFKYPGAFGDHELVAGGAFTTAGGVTANYVARWQEDPINAFPPPAWQPMGSLDGFVFAIERHAGQTYVGGNFTQQGAMNRIGRWNETSDVWEALGTGMNGAVHALASFGGSLYAGGAFTTAGGVATGGLARWNGTSWSQVGGNFLGTVNALTVHENELVIGGLYPGINASPNLARYNGVSYSTYDVGGTDAAVRALASIDGVLYVGGDFTSAGGLPAAHVARWDGAWSDVEGGADDVVRALAGYQGELQVGGSFDAVGNGSMSSPGWARFSPTGVPWMATQPIPRSVASGADASFSAVPALGYAGLSLQWLRFEDPIVDGPTGHGSIVSGATEIHLEIQQVSVLDGGTYRLVVTNDAGSDTSSAATLAVDGLVDVVSAEPDRAPIRVRLAPNPARTAVRVSI